MHDVLIVSGVYALVGREVTTSTVAALLTILGYSLYDTIIVFDRVRENIPRMPSAAFSQIVNRSMSEVITRSLATSFCTLLPILSLLLFGGDTLKDFAFALLIGVASGTYSSIFIATPVLTHWKEREPAYRARRQRLIDEMGYLPKFPEENVVAKVGDEPEPAPAAAVPAGVSATADRAAVEEPQAEPVQPRSDRAPAEVDRADGAEPEREPEPMSRAPEGDGARADRQQQRSQRRRRQQRRRRKHGRHR
jgi:SecD/SecF fusion protein